MRLFATLTEVSGCSAESAEMTKIGSAPPEGGDPPPVTTLFLDAFKYLFLSSCLVGSSALGAICSHGIPASSKSFGRRENLKKVRL